MRKNKMENNSQNEHNDQEQTVGCYQFYEVFIFSGIHNKNPPERYYYSIIIDKKGNEIRCCKVKYVPLT